MSSSLSPKPVTILTGFLGAGKTTFLNHLLDRNEARRYAIIENEFGKRGIDNELILRPDETIVELNSGCLCCTLSDSLYDLLNDLHERRDQFDEIIIEATGLADPTGLAQPFLAHPMIKKHFPLRTIICLVDAELIEQQLQETEEAIRQITFSDILLINKADLVSHVEVEALAGRLWELNPLATVYHGYEGHFPPVTTNDQPDRLEAIYRDEHAPTAMADATNGFPVQKPHAPHSHSHTDVVSLTFSFDRPFDPQVLHQQLFVYLTFQSNGLYRMKGLVAMAGEDRQFIVQSVGKRLDLRPGRPWRSTEKRQSVVVFIGKGLQRPGLERVLNRCLIKAKATTV